MASKDGCVVWNVWGWRKELIGNHSDPCKNDGLKNKKPSLARVKVHDGFDFVGHKLCFQITVNVDVHGDQQLSTEC